MASTILDKTFLGQAVGSRTNDIQVSWMAAPTAMSLSALRRGNASHETTKYQKVNACWQQPDLRSQQSPPPASTPFRSLHANWTHLIARSWDRGTLIQLTACARHAGQQWLPCGHEGRRTEGEPVLRQLDD